jgi:hypothetical protein
MFMFVDVIFVSMSKSHHLNDAVDQQERERHLRPYLPRESIHQCFEHLTLWRTHIIVMLYVHHYIGCCCVVCSSLHRLLRQQPRSLRILVVVWINFPFLPFPQTCAYNVLLGSFRFPILFVDAAFAFAFFLETPITSLDVNPAKRAKGHPSPLPC